jgi:hypothetical protein
LREFCAHRGASLYFARNGECGLRCWYHGWKYDVDGHCLDQPNMPDDRRFSDKIRQPAYPCVERAGVVWTYLGPAGTAPPLHELEWTLVPEGHVYVDKRLQRCHWTQGMEGDLDSSHLAFLHAGAENPTQSPTGSGVPQWRAKDTSPRLEMEPFAGGILHAARRNAGEDAYYWRVAQWFFPGFTTIPPSQGDAPLTGHSWTPIDDRTTWVFEFGWHPGRPLTEAELAEMRGGNNFFAPLIPGTFTTRCNASNDYAGPDAPPARQPWMRVRNFQAQDMAATESMGALYDRTQENLSVSDLLIARTRQALLDAARALQRGEAPPGRDPAAYRLRPVSAALPRSVNDWVAALAEPMSTRPETFRPSI